MSRVPQLPFLSRSKLDEVMACEEEGLLFACDPGYSNRLYCCVAFCDCLYVGSKALCILCEVSREGFASPSPFVLHGFKGDFLE